MVTDFITDAMQPKPNPYFMTAVMDVLEGPMTLVREAYEKVRRTLPSAPESKVSMGPSQLVEGTEALAYMDRIEGYKESYFAQPEDPTDLSFMAAIEIMNANRAKFVEEQTRALASSLDDVVFG